MRDARLLLQASGTLLVLIALPPDRVAAQVAPPAAPAVISVNQNPVVAAPVVLHWPTPGGQARVDVYTMTGAPVTFVTFASDVGRWPWDLTSLSGAPVANGAYYIVVTLSDNTRLRRRLLVAR